MKYLVVDDTTGEMSEWVPRRKKLSKRMTITESDHFSA